MTQTVPPRILPALITWQCPGHRHKLRIHFEEGIYGVESLDTPGAFAAGRDPVELVRRVVEAIHAHAGRGRRSIDEP